MNHCLNCKKTLQPEDNYCRHCGQPTYELEQSVVKLVHKVVHEALDIDGRIMRTVKALLLQPGLVSAQYRDGKRIRYTPPLRMYLVTSVLLFFITSLLKTPTEGSNIQISVLLLPDGLLEHIPKLMFVLLPVFAGILQLFFRHTHYIFNLVFAVHIHIFSYAILMIVLPLFSVTKIIESVEIIQIGLLCYLLVYPLLAIKRFYQQSWFKSVLITTISIFAYLTLMGFVFEIVIALI